MFPEIFAPLFDAAEQAFSEAQDLMKASGQEGLDISRPGAQFLTRTESALIEAVRAAQNDDSVAVGAILQSLMLNAAVSAHVKSALTLLAECMAGAGHWLLQEGETE
ncbi:hypothetical protein AA106555_0599 [Neokomagataea thailandica NBRC 106555]|nr:hypothetical protein AA106555_0599 [Neokomagataea thailandica NBRC 106555]